MKIAICLYGKCSGTNNRGDVQGFRAPYEFLQKNVLTQETDIFFHTWDDDPLATKELIELYSPKKFLAEKQLTFNHPYKHYDFVPSGPWNTQNYLSNNYSRFYSFKTAMSLIDDSYDLVLLSRFDNVFFKQVDFSLFEPKNFYVSNWHLLHYGWGFNDSWFISGVENMRQMSLIYDRLDNYLDLNHSGFFKFIKMHGMNEMNITSPHIIWKYRTVELGLENYTYSYGLEYKTWGLLRRLEQREDPWAFPDTVDIMIPSKVIIK